MTLPQLSANDGLEVTVFVTFGHEELPTSVNAHSAALFISREEPRWSIGAVQRDSFRLGRYDQMPVSVRFRHGPSVIEESRGMLSRLPPATSRVCRGLASGTARFELHWDVCRDRDVAPETALLVVSCAQALARFTGGVVLIDGTRWIDKSAEFSLRQAHSILLAPQAENDAHRQAEGRCAD